MTAEKYNVSTQSTHSTHTVNGTTTTTTHHSAFVAELAVDGPAIAIDFVGDQHIGFKSFQAKGALLAFDLFLLGLRGGQQTAGDGGSGRCPSVVAVVAAVAVVVRGRGGSRRSRRSGGRGVAPAFLLLFQHGPCSAHVVLKFQLRLFVLLLVLLLACLAVFFLVQFRHHLLQRRRRGHRCRRTQRTRRCSFRVGRRWPRWFGRWFQPGLVGRGGGGFVGFHRQGHGSLHVFFDFGQHAVVGHVFRRQVTS